MLLITVVAHAHHGVAPQQLPVVTQSTSGLEDQGAQVAAGLQLAVQDFDHLQRGWQRYAPRSDGNATIVTWSAMAAAQTQGGTSLRLLVPLSLLHVSATESAWRVGAGDAALEVFQRWKGVQLGAGILAPTGRYEDAATLSITDVGDDLTLTTYDTRASLGMGAWRARGTIALGTRWGRWGLQMRAVGMQTLSKTRDGIRWGQDAVVSSRVPYAVREGVEAWLGVDGWAHLADRVPQINEETGETFEAALGERVGLRGSVGVALQVSPAVTCQVSAWLPLVQWVAGVQLVENLGASAVLTVAVPMPTTRSLASDQSQDLQGPPQQTAGQEGR